MYKKVIVHAGDGGFGGPLIIAPDEKKNVIEKRIKQKE